MPGEVAVPRGGGRTRVLTRRLLDLGDLALRWGEDRLPLTEILAMADADALVLLHEGELAFEWYARPEVERSVHRVYSITKSLVGVVAGALVERDLLDPHRAVTSYVPELGAGGYAPATVRDLLDMRTGGAYAEDRDDEVATLLACRAGAGGAPFGSVHEMLGGVRRVALHHGPFCYRSLDTEALGWVLERAAGTSMVSLLTSLLLAPLGFEADAAIDVDLEGSAAHSGGLALRARDLARFGQLLLDSGAAGDHQIVSPRFVRDLRRGGEDGYRSQFWIPERGARQVVGLGIHGQMLLVDGASATVAVVLSSWPGPRDRERMARMYALLRQCGAAASGTLAESRWLHR